MAYRALYRQWRPKDFSHVVGQKAIIEMDGKKCCPAESEYCGGYGKIYMFGMMVRIQILSMKWRNFTSIW